MLSHPVRPSQWSKQPAEGTRDLFVWQTLPGTLAICLVLGTIASATHLPNPLSFVYDDGNGHTLPYRLFLPPNHDQPGASFPLVTFLHGAAEQGTDNTFSLGGQQGLIDATQSGRFESFLLVPQTNSGWFYSGNPAFTESLNLTEQIINQLESQYSIDASRRYLTGISLGGHGTWNFIIARPDMFDAAVPLAGFGDASQAHRAKDVRIWAFHGRNDAVVPTSFARQMIEGVRQAGGSPLYSETIDDHNGSGKFLDDPTDELYSWMFEGTEPALASLIYNARNGNVKLLANEAPGGLIGAFGLRAIEEPIVFIGNGGFTLDVEFSYPDTILVDGVPINTNDLLSTADDKALFYNDDVRGPLGGVIDLGNLLPPDLNFQTVSHALSFQAYRSPDTGANLRFFQIFVVNVPEPSSIVPLAVGMLAVFRRRTVCA